MGVCCSKDNSGKTCTNQAGTSGALHYGAQSNVNYPQLNIFAFPKYGSSLSGATGKVCGESLF